MKGNQLPVAPQEELDHIQGQVKNHLGGRVQDFYLEVLEQGLVLRGRTHTFYAKQMAQQIVMEKTSLRIQANAIEVL